MNQNKILQSKITVTKKRIKLGFNLIKRIGSFILPISIFMSPLYGGCRPDCRINASEMKSIKRSYPLYTQKDKERIESRVLKIGKEDYKTVIKELKTPLEAMIYCTEVLKYESDEKVWGEEDYYASFKNIHQVKKDDCDGGALAAAAILSDNGFPPYIAILSNSDSNKNDDNSEAHAIFIYKTQEKKYCSIGINKEDFIQNAKNLKELMRIINLRLNSKYDQIMIYDLTKKYPDFIDNDTNNDVQI